MAVFAGATAAQLLLGGAVTTGVGKQMGEQKGSPLGQQKNVMKALVLPVGSMAGCSSMSCFGMMMVMGMMSQMQQVTRGPQY